MFRRLGYFSKWALMGHRTNIGPNFGKTLTLLNLTNPTDPTTVSTVTLTHRPTDKPVEWALEFGTAVYSYAGISTALSL